MVKLVLWFAWLVFIWYWKGVISISIYGCTQPTNLTTDKVPCVSRPASFPHGLPNKCLIVLDPYLPHTLQWFSSVICSFMLLELESDDSCGNWFVFWVLIWGSRNRIGAGSKIPISSQRLSGEFIWLLRLIFCVIFTEGKAGGARVEILLSWYWRWSSWY